MCVLRITNSKSTVPAANKSHLFVLCSLHARERAPAESCIRFAEHILEPSSYDYDNDNEGGATNDAADIAWIRNYTVT